MRAVNPGTVWQLHKFVKARCHHGWGALEQAAAAAGEQGVATEQPGAVEIGNMAKCMAWSGDHAELQAEFGNGEGVPARYRIAHGGNGLLRGTVDAGMVTSGESRNAADMIAMMMGG